MEGGTFPRITSTLWIPETAREVPKRILRCEVCHRQGILKEFPLTQRQQWRRHVIACAKRNSEVVDGDVAEAQKSAFRSQADPERFMYDRKRHAETGKKPKKILTAV